MHKIAFDELPIVYYLSSLFIYTSRFEGFGIPIIEALQCGVPVIAATGSCLEEAGGPSSVYVSPDDVPALTKAINKLLAEDNTEQIAAGKEYAKKFEHANIAKELMQVYQELVKQ